LKHHNTPTRWQHAKSTVKKKMKKNGGLGFAGGGKELVAFVIFGVFLSVCHAWLKFLSTH
jgi:hypothetical protein